MRVSTINACALAMLAVLAGACGGDSAEPSRGERALGELQAKYDELLGNETGAAVDWAADDIENIGDWEYKVLELDAAASEELEAVLNEHGNERWEAFWVAPTADRGLRVFMKRPSRSYLSKLPLSALGKLLLDGSSSE